MTAIFMTISCVDRFVIPSNINSSDPVNFGAGDTTFLQIKPLWDIGYGIDQPTEISIAQDGRIFIADKGRNSILVIDQNGETPMGFEQLLDLTDNSGSPVSPIDVDIDKKMNVFFIDGSQKIFVWNQFWNQAGINRVSTSGTFKHSLTDVDTTVDAGTEIWMALLNDQAWELINIELENDNLLIDSLLQPHIFYDGSSSVNKYLDTYYDSDSSLFSALTSSSNDENKIFVTDNFGGINNQYRILQIDFKKSLLLELSSGDYVWSFIGHYGSTIKGFGTGAGTVNEPLSLDVDYQGNLYYTQTGDYFPVHKISPNLSGDFAIYTSGFQPEVDDIMNSDMFNFPTDVAIDNNMNTYVVDQMNRDVTVFTSGGDFFKKAGYNDTDNSLSMLNEPVAAAVDQRGVLYVCDKGDGAIYRFKLSNTLNDEIILED
tara:strand:- start:483 stop:1769 length:1287 start_codon:yes stop_codon:yes gene_type:complete